MAATGARFPVTAQDLNPLFRSGILAATSNPAVANIVKQISKFIV